MNEIYLDNAATTKVCDEAIEAINEAGKVLYGNPSSLYKLGMDSEKILDDTRCFLGNYFGVESKEIFFTSGGTESNNLAVIGISKAYKRDGMHIITTEYEHPSVGKSFDMLEEEGFKVTKLKLNANGHVDLNDLKQSLTKDTILVSIMEVNNELGSCNNIKEIGSIIKEYNSNIKFHVDGVQGFMKLKNDLKKSKVDLYSCSSHKIYGPKGVGILYIKQGTKIKPLIYGGQQQQGLRPGTENLIGINGFLAAAKRIKPLIESNYKNALYLKDYLIKEISEKLSNWKINSIISNGNINEEVSSPYVLSIRSFSIKGEVILHALEDYNIYVSTGSACSSKKLNVSHVLKSIGLSDIESDRTIRISIGENTNKEEIDKLIEALVKIDSIFGRFIKK